MTSISQIIGCAQKYPIRVVRYVYTRYVFESFCVQFGFLKPYVDGRRSGMGDPGGRGALDDHV